MASGEVQRLQVEEEESARSLHCDPGVWAPPTSPGGVPEWVPEHSRVVTEEPDMRCECTSVPLQLLRMSPHLTPAYEERRSGIYCGIFRRGN